MIHKEDWCCEQQMREIGEIGKTINVLQSATGRNDILKKEITPALLYQCQVCKEIKII